MKQRMRYSTVDQNAYKALLGMEQYVENAGLEESLLDLVKLRASQINQCAYCLDMHTKDALASGEDQMRLMGLNAWREMPFYSDRERAALAWTEAVTVLTDGFVPDSIYEEVRPHFTEQELVGLTMAIVAINSWNRMNVAFRTEPGRYQSKRKQREMDDVKVQAGH